MSETEAPLLQLNGVSVVYDGHAVIDDLSLEVGRGEFVVIHGSTGCGKSTILRLFAGLIDPTKGEVVVAETALTSSTRPSADGSGAPWAS